MSYTDDFVTCLKGKSFVSRKGDVYTVLENGDISKNGQPRYKFAGSLNAGQAYYKLGSNWAGVAYNGERMDIFRSFFVKVGVRFDKRPFAVLIAQK